MFFVKLPITVEAVQFVEGADLWRFTAGRIRVYANHAMIDTLEGAMRAEPGDWIVKGVEGEVWPVKPHIFEQTYKPLF